MSTQLFSVAVMVAAIIGAAVAIGRASTWMVRLLRRVGHLVDDLTGEPARPGIPERPGVLDRLAGIEDHVRGLMPRLAALEKRMAALEAQMQPNGGTTLRDAVDRLAPQQTEDATQ